MSEDLTGRRLGHYRIDGVLGKGGMSVMYRATDIRLGRKVALKIIAEHLTGDAEFRERFVDEARNTSAIDHANVVPLYDFGEVDGLLFIAMRLVDGSDLASLIKGGPLAPARALSLLGQVAEALDNLHERGLVHLDVKPANVLVTSRESAGEHVYVADFGLTRRGATGHRTRGGDFLGSPTYAAPEHLRGEPVDGRTDAYSLACVLFACLAGRPPFQGEVSAVIQGHLNRDVPRLTEFVVLPPAIDEVIRRGMAKNSKARYADCRELIAAARQALMSVPQPAVPPARQVAGGPGGQLAAGPVPSANGHSGHGGHSGHSGYGGHGGHGGYRPPPSGPGVPTPPRAAPPVAAHSSMADPVRLRPPAQISGMAFTPDKSGTRWVAPVLVGLVAIALIVAAILFFTSGGSGDGGGGGGGGGQPTTVVPEVKVGNGEGGATSEERQPSDNDRPPTSLPVRPSR